MVSGGVGGRRKLPTIVLFPAERGINHATIRRKNDPLSALSFARLCTILATNRREMMLRVEKAFRSYPGIDRLQIELIIALLPLSA